MELAFVLSPSRDVVGSSIVKWVVSEAVGIGLTVVELAFVFCPMRDVVGSSVVK